MNANLLRRRLRKPVKPASGSQKAAQPGQLRVWWIPQVPMESFHVEVESISEAKLLLKVLADYDRFQWERQVKPDYSNAGGLEIWDGDEWEEWEDEEGRNIKEVQREERE